MATLDRNNIGRISNETCYTDNTEFKDNNNSDFNLNMFVNISRAIMLKLSCLQSASRAFACTETAGRFPSVEEKAGV